MCCWKFEENAHPLYVRCNARAWLQVKSKDKQYRSMCMFKTTSTPIWTDLIRFALLFIMLLFALLYQYSVRKHWNYGTSLVFYKTHVQSKPHSWALFRKFSYWYRQIIYIICFPKRKKSIRIRKTEPLIHWTSIVALCNNHTKFSTFQSLTM